MESEIDLRPYILAILRRWRLILICTIVIAALGGGSGTLGRNTHSASANVLIVPITSQVTLDPRFQTTNGNQATTPAAQRLALISLASSQNIAEQVLQDLSSGAQSGGGSAQQLIGQATVTSSSDLLRITVSDPDPDRALAIANAWGKAYEKLVAEVYTRSQFRFDLLSGEITTAKQSYDVAQQELEALLSDSQIIVVDNQIQQLTSLLDGTREAEQLLYSDYLTRTRELNLILTDAQTLRDQVSAQSSQSFADSFASLLLRARTVDSAAPMFQLNAGDLGADQGAAGSPLADIDQLITVLTRRHEQLLAQTNDLAQAIASGSAPIAGLDGPTRQRYIDQLASLKSTYEQLQAREDLLTQQRDQARDTLILLQKKRDEQEVARSAPQIEVRFVSASLNPQPSLLGRVVIGGVAGGVIGLLLGVLLALLLGVIIPALRKLARPEADQAARHNN